MSIPLDRLAKAFQAWSEPEKPVRVRKPESPRAPRLDYIRDRVRAWRAKNPPTERDRLRAQAYYRANRERIIARVSAKRNMARLQALLVDNSR